MIWRPLLRWWVWIFGVGASSADWIGLWQVFAVTTASLELDGIFTFFFFWKKQVRVLAKIKPRASYQLWNGPTNRRSGSGGLRKVLYGISPEWYVENIHKVLPTNKMEIKTLPIFQLVTFNAVYFVRLSGVLFIHRLISGGMSSLTKSYNYGRNQTNKTIGK